MWNEMCFLIFFFFFFKGHTENTDYNDENDDERRPEWMDQYVNIFIFPNGVFFLFKFLSNSEGEEVKKNETGLNPGQNK